MFYLSKEEILTPQEGKENGSIFIHTDITSKNVRICMMVEFSNATFQNTPWLFN